MTKEEFKKLKNKRVWLYSDTHFFHKAMLKHAREGDFKSIEEMHEHIIKMWNESIGKEDIVIHLGDVALGPYKNRDELKVLISRLNGIKILIPGNHDYDVRAINRHFFNEMGFESVEENAAVIPVGNALLSHYPLPNVPEGYINYHGHVHRSASASVIGSERHVNVCADLRDYKPLILKPFSEEK